VYIAEALRSLSIFVEFFQLAKVPQVERKWRWLVLHTCLVPPAAPMVLPEQIRPLPQQGAAEQYKPWYQDKGRPSPRDDLLPPLRPKADSLERHKRKPKDERISLH